MTPHYDSESGFPNQPPNQILTTMTYVQLIDSALAELNTTTERTAANKARREFFRKIATRQQLDTIAIALTSNTTHN
jgi:hypothetical protein